MSDSLLNAVVRKRNVLNELHTTEFTLQEQRLFCIYLAKIKKNNIATSVVKLRLKEFQEIMDLGRLNIRSLKQVVNKIKSHGVFIPLESGGFECVSIFRKVRFDKDNNNEWCVWLIPDDDLLPYLFDYQIKYFKYELWNALALTSAIQIRFYEILKQYLNIGKLELTIEELRGRLGIEKNTYQRWERFRTQIIDNCQKTLSEKTDISFTYERGKTGRGGKWLTIIFHVFENKDYTKQLFLDGFVEAAAEQPNENETADNIIDSDTYEFYFDNPTINILCELSADEIKRGELSPLDIRVLYNMMLQLNLDNDELLAAGISEVLYFKRLMDRMNAQNEKTPIKNKLAYLKQMIKNYKEGD